ncbi:MAG: hypothetical protein WAX04_13460 [Oscillospiraceae bacterium]
MTAIEYLRNLQKNYRLKPEFAEVMKKLAYRRQEQLGFSYEDIKDYLSTLTTLEGQENWFRETIVLPLISALPDNNKNLVRDIYIGFLPTHNPNAFAISAPNNEPIVVVHTSLIGSISFYNELQFISGKVMLNDINEGVDYLNKGLKHVLNSFVQDYFYEFPLLPLNLSKQEQILVEMKTLAQETFIVAHELAHICLGHLNSCLNEPLFFNREDLLVRKFNRDQQMEFEADVLAVKWLSLLKQKQDDMITQTFGSFFISFALEVFMLFHIIEVNFGIPKDTSSHPPAVSRLNYILNNCSTIMSEGDREFVKEMISNALDIESFKIK